jgi:hypothetical protein
MPDPRAFVGVIQDIAKQIQLVASLAHWFLFPMFAPQLAGPSVFAGKEPKS